MRSGRSPRRQGGYTYIAMLIAVAVLGIGLAATGMVWSHASQREKERELLFIGDQFRQAIQSYYERTPGPAKRYPQTLEELVADQRFPKPERHLRRIYTDPMTGKADWGLMEAPGGGIMGVYSRSNATPIKNTGFRERDRTIQGATNYYEWRFFYEEGVASQAESQPTAQVTDTSATPQPSPAPQSPGTSQQAAVPAPAPGLSNPQPVSSSQKPLTTAAGTNRR